ncbi:MAG TPA: cell division protein FtsL [Terriglobales bacterium]|nr:cell division protein FtsL [Terriglobales bacterium]
MAAGALAGNPQIRSPWGPTLRPRAVSASRGTPEIYFAKAIDNSRLVKVADRQRNREMAVFVATLCVLFALVMVYAWQHFSAIEYGYKIEAQRTQRDSLVELNRTLRLEEASLRDPERIDTLARQMGLEMPQAGQVISLDLPVGNAAAPVLARAAAAPVVTVEQ